MGIEPTRSAWKAGALPLSYTRLLISPLKLSGGERRIRTFVRVRGQIYSLLPLTTRPSLQISFDASNAALTANLRRTKKSLSSNLVNSKIYLNV